MKAFLCIQQDTGIIFGAGHTRDMAEDDAEKNLHNGCWYGIDTVKANVKADRLSDIDAHTEYEIIDTHCRRPDYLV